VEAIATVIQMQAGFLHPNLNLENPSDDCDLDYVPLKARPAEINHAMNNSFGFGGTNGTLVFSRYLKS
jgi:3-oxoacyl-[acyl-carrier-protein] synthase II